MKKIVFFTLFVGISHAVGPHKKHHFDLELACGGGVMCGVASSTSENDPSTPQMWNNFGATVFGGEDSAPQGVIVEMDRPIGYRANWNQTTPQPNHMGVFWSNQHALRHAI